MVTTGRQRGHANPMQAGCLPLPSTNCHACWYCVSAIHPGCNVAVGVYSPLCAPLLAGWLQADSITVDAPQWFNLADDSAISLPTSGDADAGVSKPLGLSGSADLTIRSLFVPDAIKFTTFPRPAAVAIATGLRPPQPAGVRLACLLIAKLSASQEFGLLAPVNLKQYVSL